MITIATRKLHLVQIGIGIAPEMESQTEVSYVSRLTQTEAESGGMYDHYASRYSPLGVGKIKHSGLYPSVSWPQGMGDFQPTRQYYRQEMDFMQMARSVWTPFLFYSNIYVPAQKQATLAQKCGEYLWAYGKVTNINSVSAVSDYMSPHVSQVQLEGVLRTPLTPVTWSRWRYGLEATRYSNPDLTLAETENLALDTPETWYVPCEMQGFCGGTERFWPRNLYGDNIDTGSVEFDFLKWECPYKLLSGTVADLMIVNGNTRPRTRCVLRGDTILTIRNDLGVFNYSYGRPSTNKIYTDSWTDVVMEEDVNYSITPVAAAGVPPQLSWHDNIISISSGYAAVGAAEAWIN